MPVLDPQALLGDPATDVVVMMKIDTEGAECNILRGLLPALRAGRVLNLLVELNKGITDDATGDISWPEWRRLEIVDTLAEVAAAGYTVLCAQFGKTAAWGYSPQLKTRAQLDEFTRDGWRSANVWITRDFTGDEALPEAAE